MDFKSRKYQGSDLSKERAFGALFLILGTTLLTIYLVSFFSHRLPLPIKLTGISDDLHNAAVEIPVLILVITFFLMIIRIGWNMLTAPPAKSLEEQEGALSQN